MPGGHYLLDRECFSLLRPLFLKQFQPRQHERVRECLAGFQLGGRFAPVKADPTGGEILVVVDELAELLGRALEAEGFLDHDRLANVEAFERFPRFSQLSFLGIDVDG